MKRKHFNLIYKLLKIKNVYIIYRTRRSATATNRAITKIAPYTPRRRDHPAKDVVSPEVAHRTYPSADSALVDMRPIDSHGAAWSDL